MTEHEATQHGGKAKRVKAAPTEAVGVSSPAALAPKTALQALKPSKRVFVSALTDPRSPGFLNATQAYAAAHPQAASSTQRVEGSRTLTNPAVLAAVDEALKARGWDRERVLYELDRNASASWEKGKLPDHREAVMDIAKVQALIVDRVETKSVSDKELDTMRRIVSETLTQGGGAS